MERALLAPVAVVTSMVASDCPATELVPRLLVEILDRVILAVWPEFAPIWNWSGEDETFPTACDDVPVVLPASVSRMELPYESETRNPLSPLDRPPTKVTVAVATEPPLKIEASTVTVALAPATLVPEVPARSAADSASLIWKFAP